MMQGTSHSVQFLAIHFITPLVDEEKALATGNEFESLVATLGGRIIERLIEFQVRPDNRTYIGQIKLKEVTRRIKREAIDVVVLNTMAKPRQLHLIKEELQKYNPTIEVWDRVDLILQIFDKHARTTEAKLQIKLARMRYMGPRIYGMGKVLSQQGGGVGAIGSGETNTELMRRHWRSEMKQVLDEIEKANKNKKQQLERRKRAGLKTVAIVGYTNAGKSSLFNYLTGKKTVVENVLFATLDSSIGKMYLASLQEEVLLSDTIGFIRDLPPKLISAFKSTLMESMYADILLHVIDASDPEVSVKIDVVNTILQELGRSKEDMLFVFNKIDTLTQEKKEDLLATYQSLSPLFISVKSGVGIVEMKESLAERI